MKSDSADSSLSGSKNFRIFLSYGHDTHVALAEKLKNDLEEMGHEIWFDRNRLAAGVDWEASIEEGLDWAAGENGRVILLMTPHSVRRPDGYCLNEIARAISRQVSILPVMVVWCEPPLSICRIQWLDMQDCIPVVERTEKYQTRFDLLVRALHKGPECFEGSQARLLDLLDPLPFDAEIEQHLPRFTGRRWLFDQIDEWLDDPAASRVFWITGPPGVGKTAISAWICAHNREVAAYHLCRKGHVHKADPRRCVLSICYQLGTQLPDYLDRLRAANLEEIVKESNAQTLFDRLLVQPLSHNFGQPDRTIVLLIDALDEATEGNRNELAEFLASEFERTPTWMRLIITSRPDREVVEPLQGFADPLELRGAGGNLDDIREFVTKELGPLAKSAGVESDAIHTISQCSEGIFSYVEWVREEISRNRLSFDRLDEFPKGLGGFYALAFRRQFPGIKDFEIKTRPGLELIIAAREPLVIDQVAAVLGWDAYRAKEFIRALGSLISGARDGFRPFHSSVFEWLADEERSGPYFVDPRMGHVKLAESGWKHFREGLTEMPDYYLAQLPAHLGQAGFHDRLLVLLTDKEFVRVKIEKDSVFDVAVDYVVLAETSSAQQDRAWINLLDTCVGSDSESGRLQLRQALNQHFGTTNNWPDGLQEYMKTGKSFWPLLFLAETLLMEERGEESVTLWRRMVDLAEDLEQECRSRASVGLATALQYTGDLDRAVKELDRHIQQIDQSDLYRQPYAWALYQKGVCLRRLSRNEEAWENLETLYQGSDDDEVKVSALHHLGNIDLAFQRFNEAEEKYRRCLEMREDVPWNFRRAFELRGLARVFAATNRLDEALEAFEEAFEVSLRGGNLVYLERIEKEIGELKT